MLRPLVVSAALLGLLSTPAAAGAATLPSTVISSPSVRASGPTVAVNGSGQIAVLWSQATTSHGGYRVVARMPDGRRLPVAEDADERRVAIGDDGTVAVARTKMATYDPRSSAPNLSGSLWVRVARPGREFGKPERLSADLLLSQLGDLAVAADGAVATTWTDEDDDGQWRQRLSLRPPGGRFGAPTGLVTGTLLGDASLVASADGRLIVSWPFRDRREGIGRVAVREPGGATFGAPVPVGRGVARATFNAGKLFAGPGGVELAGFELTGSGQRLGTVPVTGGEAQLVGTGHRTGPQPFETYAAFGMALPASGQRVAAWTVPDIRAVADATAGIRGRVHVSIAAPGSGFRAPVAVSPAKQYGLVQGAGVVGRRTAIAYTVASEDPEANLPGRLVLRWVDGAGRVSRPRLVSSTGGAVDSGPQIATGGGLGALVWCSPRGRVHLTVVR